MKFEARQTPKLTQVEETQFIVVGNPLLRCCKSWCSNQDEMSISLQKNDGTTMIVKELVWD